MPRKRVITWGSLIDRFIMEQDIRGLTEATLDSYRWTLDKAVDYWGHDTDPLSITEDDIVDVLGRWRSQKCSPSTIANRISCFHTFFRWLSKKYKVYDPAREIERPRKDSPELRWLNATEVEDILLEAAKVPRDQLVVWLYAMSGIRRGEGIALRWRDVDAQACAIRVVLGKGRKGRMVAMPVILAELLADTRARLQEAGEYAELHYVCPRARVVQAAFALHTTWWHDEPMASATPNKIIARVAREAGIASPTFVGPHVLRRSFATAFLKSNKRDIYTLKDTLGHSRIDTTEKYLAPVEREQSREAVRNIEWFGKDDA